MIGGWLKLALKDANLNDSPGSFRSAVASHNWSSNLDLDDVLRKGNWRSANVFLKHYYREIIPSTKSTSPTMIPNHFSTLE